MKKLLTRLVNATKIFWIAFKKPQSLNSNILEITTQMFQFLADTAKERHPMQCSMEIQNIAHIIYGEGEENTTILHLWCGVAEKDNPLTRIKELSQDNERLRYKLAIAEAELLKTKNNNP